MGTGIYTPIRASRCSATRASASCARQQSRVHAPTFAHAAHAASQAAAHAAHAASHAASHAAAHAPAHLLTRALNLIKLVISVGGCTSPQPPKCAEPWCPWSAELRWRRDAAAATTANTHMQMLSSAKNTLGAAAPCPPYRSAALRAALRSVLPAVPLCRLPATMRACLAHSPTLCLPS